MGSESAYAQVNRIKIDNLTKNFDIFVDKIDKKFDSLEETNRKLYNHLSSRLPWWAMSLLTVLVGTVGFLFRIVIEK